MLTQWSAEATGLRYFYPYMRVFFYKKKKKKKKRKRNDSFRKHGRLHYGIFAYRFPEPVPS